LGSDHDPTLLAALKFCLSLFHGYLKKGLLDDSDESVRKMAAPFLPLLGQCLRLSGAAAVVTVAMRCMCTLLGWGLPVTAGFSQAVGQHMLMLMCRGGALVSTDNELVQACMKGLTSLFQLSIQRNEELIKRADQVADRSRKVSVREDLLPLSLDSCRALVSLLIASVTEVMTTFQSVSYQLIKIILEIKLIVPEIYDLVDKVLEQTIISHRKVST